MTTEQNLQIYQPSRLCLSLDLWLFGALSSLLQEPVLKNLSLSVLPSHIPLQKLWAHSSWPERQRSQELLSTGSRKSCVSTSTKESCSVSSAPAKFQGIPLEQSPRNGQAWPALLPQHRFWWRQLQGMCQQETRLQQLTCLYLPISLVLWPNRFWNLPNDIVCQRVPQTN